MEFFLTIISAVIIFTLGQISLKLIIEPIHELKKEIVEVLNAMVFYANKISSPNSNNQEIADEVGKILRKYASSLEAKSSIIPFYGVFELFRILPSKKYILEAKSLLIGLSNSIDNSKNNSGLENSSKIDNVKKLLTAYSKSAWYELFMVLFIIGIIVFLISIAIDDAVQLYCNQ